MQIFVNTKYDFVKWRFHAVAFSVIFAIIGAALFLFQFGTGPIKGFAVTLLIGLFASVFTAFFVSRVIFDVVYRPEKRPVEISI